MHWDDCTRSIDNSIELSRQPPSEIAKGPSIPGGRWRLEAQRRAMASSSGSVAMTADGSSESWENNKGNQTRLGNEFLKHISNTDSALSHKWGTDWATAPEQYAAHTEIYEHGASFLVYTYKKSSGKPLELGGVKTVWGGWIHQAWQRFRASERHETKVCHTSADSLARVHTARAHVHCTDRTRLHALPVDVGCATTHRRCSSSVGKPLPAAWSTGTRA